MITAATFVMVSGLAMGIGYIWGSHNATDNVIFDYENLFNKDEELL